tara:strand:- start:92 stop:619 length:528 start_codon:yes stop_codon:yes gene_type:complete
MSKKETKTIYSIISRYLIIFLLGLGELFIFYAVLTPTTLYPVYAILDIFYEVDLSGIVLSINNYSIEIVKACVAGAAYYLLIALNLATPMSLNKRIRTLLYIITALFALNVARITFLSVLFVNNVPGFDFTHKIFWYGLSTVFVIGVWFSSVHIFKIKQIPVYSDFLSIKKMIRK